MTAVGLIAAALIDLDKTMANNHATLDPKTQEAIAAALESNWAKALEINQELLEKYPGDIDTMNRLARALVESGELNKAGKIYQQVLAIDPYNLIAQKNLKRLSSIKKHPLKEERLVSPVRGDLFLEEPGKTVVVTLEDIAMPQVLATLQTGDRLELQPHKNSVTIVSNLDQRVGKINGGLGETLAKDMRLGSTFEAFVKYVNLHSGGKGKSEVALFIRESVRSAKVTKPPFPITSSSFTPYVREEALNLLANQAPVLAENEDSVEEIPVREIPGVENQEQSLEELAEKEAEENDRMDQD